MLLLNQVVQLIFIAGNRTFDFPTLPLRSALALAINSESFLKYIQHVYTLFVETPEHQII
jgi:hypothetical protein